MLKTTLEKKAMLDNSSKMKVKNNSSSVENNTVLYIYHGVPAVAGYVLLILIRLFVINA